MVYTTVYQVVMRAIIEGRLYQRLSKLEVFDAGSTQGQVIFEGAVLQVLLYMKPSKPNKNK